MNNFIHNYKNDGPKPIQFCLVFFALVSLFLSYFSFHILTLLYNFHKTLIITGYYFLNYK